MRGGNTLVLPDEGELTDDAFLRTHCIVPTILESGGASGIRLRETSRGRGIAAKSPEGFASSHFNSARQ